MLQVPRKQARQQESSKGLSTTYASCALFFCLFTMLFKMGTHRHCRLRRPGCLLKVGASISLSPGAGSLAVLARDCAPTTSVSAATRSSELCIRTKYSARH